MAKIGISNAVYTVQSALTRNNTSISNSMIRLATGSTTAVAGDHATFKALSNNFELDIVATQSAIKSTGVTKRYLAAYISTIDNLSFLTSKAMELAVLGANDMNTDAEANAIDQEAVTILNEMIRISNSEYKGKRFFELTSRSEFLSMGGRGAEYEVTLGTNLEEVLGPYDFDSKIVEIKSSFASTVKDIDSAVLAVALNVTDIEGALDTEALNVADIDGALDTEALNVADIDGALDTDDVTSELESLQQALNQMRVNAASDYAALEEAQILMTDLNVEHQKGYNIFSQISFSAETAVLAKNQILQSAANAMLVQANNAQVGLLKVIE